MSREGPPFRNRGSTEGRLPQRLQHREGFRTGGRRRAAAIPTIEPISSSARSQWRLMVEPPQPFASVTA